MGPDTGETISLSGEMTSIGRASNNDIVVEESGVSRRHAAIRNDPSGFWIMDLGSRNGTFVNGEQIEGEGVRLHDMDRIELGGIASVYWVFRELEATIQIPRASGPTSLK